MKNICLHKSKSKPRDARWTISIPSHPSCTSHTLVKSHSKNCTNKEPMLRPIKSRRRQWQSSSPASNRKATRIRCHLLWGTTKTLRERALTIGQPQASRPWSRLCHSLVKYLWSFTCLLELTRTVSTSSRLMVAKPLILWSALLTKSVSYLPRNPDNSRMASRSSSLIPSSTFQAKSTPSTGSKSASLISRPFCRLLKSTSCSRSPILSLWSQPTPV